MFLTEAKAMLYCRLVIVACLLLSCNKAANEMRPGDSISLFEKLLSKADSGDANEQDAVFFRDLIKSNVSVRLYIAKHFATMSIVRRTAILLTIGQLADSQEYDGLFDIVESALSDPDIQMAGILCMRSHATPHRKQLLQSLILAERVQATGLARSIDVYASHYGLEGIEERALEFMRSANRPIGRRAIVSLAVLATTNDSAMRSEAKDTLDQVFVDFRQGIPGHFDSNLFHRLTAIEWAGDDRLLRHAEWFALNGPIEVREGASAYAARFAGVFSPGQREEP